MSKTLTQEAILKKIEEQKSEFLKDYQRIVESPSISASSAHKKDVEETARIAVEFLEKAGANARLVPTRGNPGVFGRIENDPKAPTVAIYCHLDVQPAEKGKDGWTKEPFSFQEENGRFYSRGTTDDKGPAMTALWAAKLAKEFQIPINIEFIWETEEEIGSPNFDQFMEAIVSDVKAKTIVVSDTVWVNAEQPAISMALRGNLALLLKLKTAKKDAHSGMAGGPARNPIAELCEIVTRSMNVQTGEITIPGFDRTWTPPTKEDLDEFLRAGFSVEYFKRAYGLTSLRFEDPAQVASAVWAKPTLEVHGMVGGYQGEGVKTVVPHEAELKLSFRLIAGQDLHEVAELFKAHVRSINPDVEVEVDRGAPPYASPKHLPDLEAVREALRFATGRDPAHVREGGSIGAITVMERILKKPILFMGISLPEDSYHGPDESFAWSQVETGVKAFLKYFSLVAQKS